MNTFKSLCDVSFALVITLTGCSTYKPVQLHQESLNNEYSYYKTHPYLYSGDVVKYTLKDGRHETITVQSTTPQGIIISSEHLIPYNQIVAIERRDLSTVKTVAFVGASSAVAFIAFMGIMTGALFAALLGV
ncbi:hypothetical protein ACIP6T_11010 [Pantoea sp. NPDC088449]|uniref:hypothetical protein n=1 Tax=Pantoea sp. NPDC088449 TaxID=3364392 RepID=UPI0037F2BCC5